MITTLEQAKEALVSVPLRGINCNGKDCWKMLPKSKEIQQPELFHLYYRCIPPQRKGFFSKNLKNSGANRSKISRADGSLK